jgi:hypothetical protein
MKQQVFCVRYRKLYCKRNLILKILDYTQLDTHTHTHTLLSRRDQPVGQAATYTTYYKHNGQISMLSTGFDPAISEIK